MPIVDEHTRECLAIRCDRSITGEDVIETLAKLFAMHGVPEHIRSDNGKLSKPGEWVTGNRAFDSTPFPLLRRKTRRCDYLTIDLSKFKSLACLYSGEGDATFRTISTCPRAIHDLLVELTPDRLVIEVGTVSGWVHDAAQALGVDVEVANRNTEGWRWRRGKRKIDRDDALKLAWLSSTGQLPTVWMPQRKVRSGGR